MIKTKHTLTKMICVLLTFLMLLPCLVACGKKDDPSISAKTVVGTVNGKNVYYDELYYLVTNYMPSVKESVSPDDAEAVRTELDRLIRENIVVNYAILGVCESVGLTYDERALSDRVDKTLELTIQNSFGGSKEAYRESLAKIGLTERYLRYTLGLDLLYSDLLTAYPEKGLVAKDEAAIRAYIEENFIHVYHLALFNDEGDDPAVNLAKITEAREMLAAKETTMYQLIKNGFKDKNGNTVLCNEDVLDISGDGYYITRGTMDEKYEAAAFSLKIGDVSEVVKTLGENNYGNVVSAYYVIQRFELDQNYINEHFYELQDEYYSAVIYNDMNEIKKELTFTPNEFYGELDLLTLPKPNERSNTWFVALCAIGGLAIGAGVVVSVVLIVRKFKKKNG